MLDTHRTKIVCTIGPSTEDDDVLRSMIKDGMSVARLNFSHGDHAYHRQNIERVRRLADEAGVNIAIMGDTKGPEIRTRCNEDHRSIPLETGDPVVVTTRDVESTTGLIAIDYTALPNEVGPGSAIFIDDGLVELSVDHVIDGTDIQCVVTNRGFVGERKGVNVPNVIMELPAVTEQDKEDIRFACEAGVDAIAASFVRDANAVDEIRALCKDVGRSDMMIIAKIESALAVSNFDAILEASDGIMVARGDLGVEIPPADVPGTQKTIIQKCNKASKPVITATQMLDSMVHNPRPTRAEVTDVANAVWDGTDCVMLSGETAAGSYPVESVRMMAEVCRKAESQLKDNYTRLGKVTPHAVSSVASAGAVLMAEHVGAKLLVCPTETGHSARIMASCRPDLPILATSPLNSTVRITSFYWGVKGIHASLEDGLSRICYGALRAARDSGYVQTDDLVVITAGDPVTSPLTEGVTTSTNVCMIAQVF